MTSLCDKTVVITGAGAGIGRALAFELAHEGCVLALSDINEASVIETKKLILAQFPDTQIHVASLDVSQAQAVHEYAALVHNELGGIHLVINNAGVALSSAIGETKRDDFEWLMNINFWGVVNGCEGFLPYLKNNDHGHIVNISSVFGMIAIPGQSSYNASKFAVRGYTEALRQEMDMNHPHITVSCVHPGGITTDIARHGRVSDKEDHAELVKTFDKLAQTTPEKAAKIIVAGIKKNRARIMVGWDAHVIHVMHRLLGVHYIRLTKWLVKRFNYQP